MNISNCVIAKYYNNVYYTTLKNIHKEFYYDKDLKQKVGNDLNIKLTNFFKRKIKLQNFSHFILYYHMKNKENDLKKFYEKRFPINSIFYYFSKYGGEPLKMKVKGINTEGEILDNGNINIKCYVSSKINETTSHEYPIEHCKSLKELRENKLKNILK